jgi:hypothetical protein
MIIVAENSNKFQKTRFWKEKLVEDVITLGPTANATLVAKEATTLSKFQGFFPCQMSQHFGLKKT